MATRKVNQTPKQLFSLDIEDEIVRANFDTLNRELTKRASAVQPPAANAVYSQVLGLFNSSTTPLSTTVPYEFGELACKISTKGNPVQLCLIPAATGPVNPTTSYSQILIGTGAPGLSKTYGISFGFIRRAVGMADQLVGNQYVSASITAIATTTSLQNTISFPSFVVEDPAPAGSWVYSFFALLGVSDSTLFMYNVQARALELK